MDLITILVLASLPFVLVPIVLISDTAIYEKKK